MKKVLLQYSVFVEIDIEEDELSKEELQDLQKEVTRDLTVKPGWDVEVELIKTEVQEKRTNEEIYNAWVVYQKNRNWPPPEYGVAAYSQDTIKLWETIMSGQ